MFTLRIHVLTWPPLHPYSYTIRVISSLRVIVYLSLFFWQVGNLRTRINFLRLFIQCFHYNFGFHSVSWSLTHSAMFTLRIHVLAWSPLHPYSYTIRVISSLRVIVYLSLFFWQVGNLGQGHRYFSPFMIVKIRLVNNRSFIIVRIRVQILLKIKTCYL